MGLLKSNPVWCDRMSEHIHKSHNVTALLYHLVCPTKYRRAVITDAVDEVLRSVCFDISNRYEITFLEIGADQDHFHFRVTRPARRS